jgi:hypothetical protein
VSAEADRRSRATGDNPVSQAMLQVAHSLTVDLLTVEVVSAFRQRGVPSILLKGPTIANWLYPDGRPRPYGDCDLLLPPEHTASAQEVLLRLGFHYGYESLGPGALEEGLFWTRGLDTVDLHSTLQGINADPDRVWAVLSRHVQQERVGGLEVDALSLAARAMHVALHAAQHGRRDAVPMQDLARALELVPIEMWQEATRIAMQLDAAGSFATGLSLLPRGETVVQRLGIEKDSSVRGLLFADTAPTVSFTLEELRTTSGIVGKLRLVARKAFPTRAHMRLYWPLARRGTLGLAAAYCTRIATKLGKLVPALIAWSRARRQSG